MVVHQQIIHPPCYNRGTEFCDLVFRDRVLPPSAWKADRDPQTPGEVHVKGRLRSLKTELQGSRQGLEALLSLEQTQYEEAEKRRQLAGVLSDDETERVDTTMRYQKPQLEYTDNYELPQLSSLGETPVFKKVPLQAPKRKSSLASALYCCLS